MKIIVVLLLFVSASAAINEWLGLPEGKFQQLDQLLDDEPFLVRRIGSPSKHGLASSLESATLNDHGFEEYIGSGVNPGPEPDKGVVEEMVDALHVILPAIKILKKSRDEQNEEYSLQFIHALKYAPSDGQVKAVLGKNIMALHQRCIAIKVEFARRAHETGLFNLIKNDFLDFHAFMGHVIAAADRRYFDVFLVFAHVAYHYKFHNHPGVQAIMTIGQMVADAACEVTMDGLFGKIKEIIDIEDKEGDFDFKDKMTASIYQQKSKICPGDLMELLKQHQHQSVKARLLNIVFENCKEVRYIRFAAGIAVDGIKLSRKVEDIKKLEMKRLNGMIKDVSDLMADNKTEEAYEAVADYVLDNLRRAMMVGVAVERQLNSSHPEPMGSPKPTRNSSPKPGPAPETAATKRRASIIEDESIDLFQLILANRDRE